MMRRAIQSFAAAAGLALVTASSAAAATITVQNNSDHSSGSLRDAIAGATTGDTITIPAGIGTITLLSQIQISNKDLTITGAGQAATTISGGGGQGLFSISGAASDVTFSSLTLTNATTTGGDAAITTAGPLTLTDVTVSDTSSGSQGAVFSSGTSLSVSRSTFTHDTSNLAGFGGSGGAIVFYPDLSTSGETITMNVQDSTFSNDTAGPNATNPSSGGAIQFQPSSVGFPSSNLTESLTVSGSTFSGDQASGASLGQGGAIAFTPTDFHTGMDNSFALTLDSDTFTGDQATAGALANDSGEGGAVAFVPSMSGTNDTDTVTVSGSNFVNDAAGSVSTNSAFGGALYDEPQIKGTGATSQLSITDSTLSGDNATGTLSTNLGGAVEFFPALDTGASGSATMTVDGATFSDNAAGGGAGSYGYGGAIEFDAEIGAADTAKLDIIGSSFDSNAADQAQYGRGGAIDFYPLTTNGTGGTQQLTLEQDSFETNAAGSTAAASGEGGAVFAKGDAATSTETIDGSTFAGNTAGSGANGGAGGAVVLDQSGTSAGSATLTNDTFNGNSAGGPTTSSPAAGGAVAILAAPSGTSVLQNDTIADNAAGGSFSQGGGVAGPAGLEYENTILVGDSAAQGSDCQTATASSGGGNVEGGSSCGFDAASDKQSANPQLGALADNGGSLETMLPALGSPVLGAGSAAHCPATDERGFTRPSGAACDSGAVQAQRPSASTGRASAIGLTTATVSGSAAPGDVGGNVMIQYVATTAYGKTVAGPLLTARSASNAFSVKLTGLKPGTTYHYRVSVTGFGTAAGVDARFTTVGAQPVDTKRPSISGRPSVGKTLKCSSGSWTGKPTRFRYRWNRNGKAIHGATKSRYRIHSADQGRKLTCTVTASNSAGAGKPATSSAVRVKSSRRRRKH